MSAHNIAARSRTHTDPEIAAMFSSLHPAPVSASGAIASSTSPACGRVIRSTVKPSFIGGTSISPTIDTERSAVLPDKYKIVLVVDQSTSMQSIRGDIITSINDLIVEQKAIKERPATFTLVKFSGADNIRTVMLNEPLEDARLLTSVDYQPNGQTALYDAIGHTIDRFDRERDVLLVIVTDGEENNSLRYTKEQVNRRIDEMKRDKGWSYVYLSCNKNTEQQGRGLGIGRSDECANITTPMNQYKSAINAMSSAIGASRRSAAVGSICKMSVQSQLNRQF